MIRLSEFSNPNGSPVGKKYELVDGKPAKVKAGRPFASQADVLEFPSLQSLANHIKALEGHQHICAGIPKNEIRSSPITTVSRPKPGAITRSDADFQFPNGAGIGLLDHDVRAETPDRLRMDQNTFWHCLGDVLCWDSDGVGMLFYPSSSSFIERTDGAQSTGLRGHHFILTVTDAGDWPRALDCIFRRCVIAGFGWIYVSQDGRQLLRSIIDDTVGRSPSRAIYSGKAALATGLRYSAERVVRFSDGDLVDTRVVIPSLTLDELAEFDRVVAELMTASAPQAQVARAAYRETRVAGMLAAGVSQTLADAAVTGAGVRRLEGPWSITLADGTTISVDQILDAPAKYHNTYCLDPAEPDYDGGRTVAKIYSDRGGVFVSSWAHGGDLVGGPSVYVLERSALDSFDVILPDQPASAPAESATTFSTPRLSKTDARDGTATTRPLSEMGNALRLFDLFGDRLRFVPEVKGWLVWEGDAWLWDISGSTVLALSGRLYLSIYEEGIGLLDGELFGRWSRASQQIKVVRNAVALLANFPQVRLPLEAIDADPMLAGLDGARQIIDLRTGLVRAAEPRDYVTKSLACDAVGDAAKAHRWVQFLGEVFDGDTQLVNWVQRWLGYCLTGETREHLFVFGFGMGSNGKSILLETMKDLAGDYARAVDIATLTDTRRDAGAASPHIAALRGVRFGMTTESEDGVSLAESLLKSLVSGDSLTARHLNSENIEFRPMLKLMMSGNHKPVVRGTDAGLWRRFRLLPFTQTFSGARRDPHLLEKLKAEGPDILAWLIQGCLMWQRQGLQDTPSTIASATASYRSDQDILGTWQAECTIADPAHETHAAALYLSYTGWCVSNGVRPAANIAFGRRLAERGFVSRVSNSKRFWSGIGLASDVDFQML